MMRSPPISRPPVQRQPTPVAAAYVPHDVRLRSMIANRDIYSAGHMSASVMQRIRHQPGNEAFHTHLMAAAIEGSPSFHGFREPVIAWQIARGHTPALAREFTDAMLVSAAFQATIYHMRNFTLACRDGSGFGLAAPLIKAHKVATLGGFSESLGFEHYFPATAAVLQRKIDVEQAVATGVVAPQALLLHRVSPAPSPLPSPRPNLFASPSPKLLSRESSPMPAARKRAATSVPEGQRCAKKGKPEGERRPPNAFFLYRSDKIPELQASGTSDEQTTLSKQIGVLWRNESEATKAAYKQRADKVAAEHKERFNYKYKPRRRN